MRSKLSLSYLLVHIKLPEDLGCVQKVLVLEDPASVSLAITANFRYINILLCVPGQKGQIEDECHPVPIDQEQECQETMDSSFGDDVGVKTVAEIDRVDVVAES